jgi:hypothetical protein
MWADSAYPATTWTVAPFKKPSHGELTHDQRQFNYYVSKVSTLLSIYFQFAEYPLRFKYGQSMQLVCLKIGSSPIQGAQSVSLQPPPLLRLHHLNVG